MSKIHSIAAKRNRSTMYRDVARFLEQNPAFSGTYGDLAIAVDRCPKRNGPAIGQVIRRYAEDEPSFDDRRIYRKDTRSPGYLNG